MVAFRVRAVRREPIVDMLDVSRKPKSAKRSTLEKIVGKVRRVNAYDIASDLLGKVSGDGERAELMIDSAEDEKRPSITVLEYFIDQFWRDVCPTGLIIHCCGSLYSVAESVWSELGCAKSKGDSIRALYRVLSSTSRATLLRRLHESIEY